MSASETRTRANDCQKPNIGSAEEPFKAQITDLSTGTELAHRACILLVEDEKTLLFAIAKMLRKRGFIVLTAVDGREAVDLLRMRQEEIALLFLDVTLPGLSSQEVLKEARRIRPDIPVILTSAHSQGMVDSSFAEMPVKHFIRKPYRLATLVHLFESVLAAP